MRRESGMTLVEAMISAVVLSTVILALSPSLRTFSTTYTAAEQSAHRTARSANHNKANIPCGIRQRWVLNKVG